MKLTTGAILLGALASVAVANHHHHHQSKLRAHVGVQNEHAPEYTWGCCANGGCGDYMANATVVFQDKDGIPTRSHGFVGVNVAEGMAGIWVGDLEAKYSTYGWLASPTQDPNVLMATAWGEHKCIHYRIWRDCLPRACFGFADHSAFPWTRDVVTPESVAEFSQFQDWLGIHSVWINSGTQSCMPYYMITENRCNEEGKECESFTNPEALAARATNKDACRAWPLDVAMDVYADEAAEGKNDPRPGRSTVRSVFLFQNGTALAAPPALLSLPARCAHS